MERINKHYLSVLAIFNNEGHIFREWLDHYLAEGVDFFYLINNFSEDADVFLPILQEYSSYIHLVDSTVPNFLFTHTQLVSYDSFIRTHILGNTEWLMIVDLDEFMFAPFTNIKQELKDLESVLPNAACVRVPWKMFGSNGHISQPRSVVKNFTKRESYSVPHAMLIKNIFKPECMLSFNIHEVHLKPSYIYANSQGDCVDNYTILQSERNISEAHIQLNHYSLQSKDYWCNVKMKRDYYNMVKELGGTVHTLDEFLENDKIFNTITDETLYMKHKAMYDYNDEIII